MSGHTVLPFLFLSAAVEAQHLNVFLTQHNITDDKKATVSQPLIRIEDIEGYSICFREPHKVKCSQTCPSPDPHVILLLLLFFLMFVTYKKKRLLWRPVRQTLFPADNWGSYSDVPPWTCPDLHQMDPWQGKSSDFPQVPQSVCAARYVGIYKPGLSFMSLSTVESLMRIYWISFIILKK